MRTGRIIRQLAVAVAVISGGAGAPLEAACLSSGDASEAVSLHRAVAPGEALVNVRRRVPNGDVLRAALCREPEALVYRVTVLRPDGRILRVTVDATSGKVVAVH